MTLRADDDIGAVFHHRFEKERRERRAYVEIAVEEHHVFAAGSLEPGTERGSLAAVESADHRREFYVGVSAEIKS